MYNLQNNVQFEKIPTSSTSSEKYQYVHLWNWKKKILWPDFHSSCHIIFLAIIL